MVDEANMVKDIEELLLLHDLRLEEWEKVKMQKDHDFSAVLEKTQKRITELTIKANQYAKSTGMSEEQLEEYLANKSNFSPKEWQMIETTKKKCDEIKIQTDEILQSSELVKIKKQAPQPAKKKSKRDPLRQRKGWKQV